MNPKTQSEPMGDLPINEYQKLVEKLRIRLNVLNASVFLLEERLNVNDHYTAEYLNRINKELDLIRNLVLATEISHKPIQNGERSWK